MSERQSKLRKLNDFRRRLPHCSASAMSAILTDIKKHGFPEGGISRHRLKDARNFQNLKHTQFGQIIQSMQLIDEDGEEQKVTICHPMALLWSAAEHCKNFSEFFKKQLLANPPSFERPWNLVFYTDEVTPGNPLATLNQRKFHAIYWSCLEFCQHALSREEAWFTVCTEYSIHVSTLAAGLSQLVAGILKIFFSEGANVANTGMRLPFVDMHGTPMRLWAKLGGMIQDGGAHKFVWHSRGDGASKFCLLCKNLFVQKSEVVDADGTNLLSSNVLNWGGLVQASSRELRKNYSFLEKHQPTMAPEAFTALQQSLGLTFHPHSILLERYLDEFVDPVSTYLHDWMHAIFVDGVFNLTLYLLLEAIIKKGLTNVYTVFSDYISKWTWPGRINGNHLHEIFTDDRRDKHRKAKHIKCQASDGLSLVCVSALFVVMVLSKLESMEVIREGCPKECAAFLALVDLIELIVATSRGAVQPKELLKAAERFLQYFEDAWGCEWMVPKFHWLLHFWRQLANLKMLLNCFCLERKHRVPKRYATDLANISKKSSRSLLMEVTSHHFGQLSNSESFSFEVGLVGGGYASKKIKDILIAELQLDPSGEAAENIKCSKVSRFSPLAVCHKGDVVLYKDGNHFRAGKVQLHCSVLAVHISMVSIMNVSKLKGECAYSEWKSVDEHILIETNLILDSCVYSELQNGNIAVLIPLEFR